MAAIHIQNVNNNDLILTSWGNDVANEVNGNVVKKTPEVGLTTQTITGTLVVPVIQTSAAQGTAVNSLVRRDYADTKVSGSGDTITGLVTIAPANVQQVLVLRSTQQSGGANINTPSLAFYDGTGATRFAYIEGSPTQLQMVSANGEIRLTAANDIVLVCGSGDQIRATGPLYSTTGNSRFFGAPYVLSSGNTANLQFYGAATNVDTIGSRSGYVGYSGTNQLQLINELASASIVYQTDNAHLFNCGATPAEVARILPSVMLIGKTTSAIATQGLSLFENGAIYATRPTGGDAPIRVNRINSVDAEYMLEVCRNGATIGRIEQDGTTGSHYATGSDRRMKTIVGPITDGLARVKAMKPYRVTWNGDPSRGTTDAFIADEMQSIVPEAVSGQPNAVTGPPLDEDDPPEGTPVMQAMGYEKLVTVTVAALKDLIVQVEALTARIDALEAAA